MNPTFRVQSDIAKRTRLPVEVAQVRDVSPRMRRITVEGPGLRSLPPAKPASWMKVFFPVPGGERDAGRAYTIRRFDQAASTMDFDLALHGDSGPASRWTAAATRGATLHIAGPRAGYTVNAAARHYLLIGDVTALPAICTILEALPQAAPTTVFVEVADASEEQILGPRVGLHTTWLHSRLESPGTTGQVELAVQGSSFSVDGCEAWIAGESSMVRSVRTHLMIERRMNPAAIHAQGYWKLGVSDHRDRD